jgi:response regulator of citrate/malate metabolism
MTENKIDITRIDGIEIIEINKSHWQSTYTISEIEGNLYAVDVYIKDGKEYKVYTCTPSKDCIIID